MYDVGCTIYASPKVEVVFLYTNFSPLYSFGYFVAWVIYSTPMIASSRTSNLVH